MKGKALKRLDVHPLFRHRAVLKAGQRHLPVQLGRGGISHFKREGDGATPAGILRPLCAFYRADRLPRPPCRLPLRPLRADDGWCDAPQHPCYNRFIRHPFSASAERLWREDHAYDVIVVLDYNMRPRIRGRGSAIFLHLMHDDGRPTAGCLALPVADLLWLLARIDACTRIVIPARAQACPRR